MNHPEDSVVLQAIEFWSTVCEEEYELSVEAAEAQQYGELPEHESKFFARIALPEIMPVLLKLLTRQDEDADEDEWNVSMAAGTCISLLAQAVGDNIVAAAIPFIEANVKSSDWRMREAAVMTFGSILDGPDPDVLRPLVTQALPILIDMLGDQHVMVKDTTAWTIGRICELVVSVIQPEVHLHHLITSLVRALDDQPRIVSNACWALNQLSENLSVVDENSSTPPTAPLSPYFEGIITSLLRVTEKYVCLLGN
jgi:importin subunit beta-1